MGWCFSKLELLISSFIERGILSFALDATFWHKRVLNENYRLPQEYIYNEKLSTENLLKENYQLKRMRNKKLSTVYLLNKTSVWIFAQ